MQTWGATDLGQARCVHSASTQVPSGTLFPSSMGTSGGVTAGRNAWCKPLEGSWQQVWMAMNGSWDPQAYPCIHAVATFNSPSSCTPEATGHMQVLCTPTALQPRLRLQEWLELVPAWGGVSKTGPVEV